MSGGVPRKVKQRPHPGIRPLANVAAEAFAQRISYLTAQALGVGLPATSGSNESEVQFAPDGPNPDRTVDRTGWPVGPDGKRLDVDRLFRLVDNLRDEAARCEAEAHAARHKLLAMTEDRDRLADALDLLRAHQPTDDGPLYD